MPDADVEEAQLEAGGDLLCAQGEGANEKSPQEGEEEPQGRNADARYYLVEV